MEIKKLLLMIAIIFAIIVPWYINYSSYFFKKTKCDRNNSLIEMNKNLNELNVCSNQELDLLIKILAEQSPNLQSINLLPKEDQYKIYADLLENYVIDPYVVKEYLTRSKINEDREFYENLNLYIKIMENNFYMNIFKKEIADTIIINDEKAKKYYEDNKNTLFANYPFTKIAPGINANAIIIDDEKISKKNYEKMLLDKKNCIPIENYNPKLVSLNDAALSQALINMKIKEYKTVILQNGKKIMLYKLSDNQGEWLPYEMVSDKVRLVMKKKLIEEKSLEEINKLKLELKIKISDKNLGDYIENKNILLKNKFSMLNGSENKILEVADSDFDLQNDEYIEEQKIKEVEQEVVK
jgi:hypothetical protein